MRSQTTSREFNRAAPWKTTNARDVGFADEPPRRLASSPEGSISRPPRRERSKAASRLEVYTAPRSGGYPADHATLDTTMSRTRRRPGQRGLAAEPKSTIRRRRAFDAELKIEIATLKNLESLALESAAAGRTKWRELASLLGANFTTAGGKYEWAGSLRRAARRDSAAGALAAQNWCFFTEPATRTIPGDRITTCWAAGVGGGNPRRDGRKTASRPRRHSARPRCSVLWPRTQRRGDQLACPPHGQQRPPMEPNRWNSVRADSPQGRRGLPSLNLWRTRPRGGSLTADCSQTRRGPKGLGRHSSTYWGKSSTRAAPSRPADRAIRYGDQPRSAPIDYCPGKRPRPRPDSELLEDRALAHDAMDASRVRRIRRTWSARRPAGSSRYNETVLP